MLNKIMKAYVITLLDSELSKQFSNKTIESGNKFGQHVEVWPAVNGSLHGNEKLNRYGIPGFLLFGHAPGVVGCFLSHYEIWQKCVEMNETLMVLEHDAEFIRALPSNIHDHYSGVLKLDPYRPIEPDYKTLVNASADESIQVIEPTAQGTHRAGEFLTGTYGYCIKPKAAGDLINFAKEVGGLPSDVFMGRDVIELKSTNTTVVKMQDFFLGENIHDYSSTARLGHFMNRPS